MTNPFKHLHLGALMAASAVYICASSPGAAQTTRQCAPRAAVVERLAESYGETRQSVGIASNNAMIEVFASADTGSWTILVTVPTGISCLLASGMSFEAVEDVLPAKGSDA
jgi:hypothetical protein